jgi:hypothetical protein
MRKLGTKMRNGRGGKRKRSGSKIQPAGQDGLILDLKQTLLPSPDGSPVKSSKADSKQGDTQNGDKKLQEKKPSEVSHITKHRPS